MHKAAQYCLLTVIMLSVAVTHVHRSFACADTPAQTATMSSVAGSLTGRLTMLLPPGQPQAGTSASKPAASTSDIVVYLESVEPGRRFAPPARHASISQKGAQFSPSLLVVCVGQTVDFPNDEDRPIEHNVFSQSPARPFDLGLYQPKHSKPVIFDKPGPVRLYCSIHRYMEGIIFVSPTPFFARVGSDGRFEITGIPAGEYLLRTWQKRPRCPERSLPVNISAGSSSEMNIEMSRK